MKKNGFILTLAISLLFFASFSYVSGWLDFSKLSKNVGCQCFDYDGDIDYSEDVAYFEGKEISVPQLAYEPFYPKVLGSSNEEKWIEVDLSEQKLRAWEGNRLFMETLVSTGLPHTPTPTGEFRIWIKLRATKMSGGSGSYYYYLPNVPYVMFFENDRVKGWKGYGLHGTYWHSDFGNRRSHGCVNLPTERAKDLYYWTTPTLVEGKGVVRSTNENQGTKIVIHE